MRSPATLLSDMRKAPGRQKPARDPRKRSFAEILEELRLLGLAGCYFTPQQYAHELAKYLGIAIVLIFPDDRDAEYYRAYRARYGSAAGLRYVPEHKLALIEVPESFEGLARLMLAFHEMSHLAAGHYIPDDRTVTDPLGSMHRTQPIVEGHQPSFALSLRAAPARHLHELDAELRARDVLLAAVYGPRIYDRQEHLAGLSESRFPRPTLRPAALRNLFG